jgi:prophage regulatory protein
MESFLRLRQVTALVGLSRSAIYARIKEGTFPKPVPIGPRTVAFIASEVEAWVQARIAGSRRAAA